MPIKAKVIEIIKKKYPALSAQQTGSLIAEQLFSPFHIQLPNSVLKQAQACVQALFSLRQSADYIQSYARQLDDLQLKDPGNKGILMSYDFHLNDEDHLRLIEVNTNAAFLAMGDLMYEAHGIDQPIAGFQLSQILENIKEECRLNGQKQPLKIAIVDDQPEQQRLYIEFLVYRELFLSQGTDTLICDFRDIPGDRNFIYNRHTDFYFSDGNSQQLKADFLHRARCFSPNPFEYFLLADKARMIDWSSAGKIKEFLPACRLVNSANQEEIWSQRKNLFFKPRQAFGSKQSYKGASISHKVFQEIVQGQFVAQELTPAREREFATPEGPQKFKFDLRFYAYQDRLQSVVGRLYQGQVTNLKTPYGGFAPVIFA
jgi:hypothetical protein